MQLRYRCKFSWLSGLYRSPLKQEDMGLPRGHYTYAVFLQPVHVYVIHYGRLKLIVNSVQPCIKTSTHGELTGLLLGSQAGSHSHDID